MKFFRMIFGFVFLATLTTTLVFSGTLENVKKRGKLNCGVSTGLPGFSATNSAGTWVGLDVDMCRAVAAAVFGNAKKVKFIPLTAKERFTALQSGEIDLLSRNTTWTSTRDTSLGLNFAGVNYYDGQGFLVSKKLGVKSALELDGASICIQAGTTTELNLADYFRSNNMKYKTLSYDTAARSRQGFESGRCDLLTSDASQLYAIKSQLKNPNNAMVLPEIISKEPLGPVVRQGDDIWFNIVRWSHIAMVNAEELGVTSNNVKKLAKGKNPAIQRLLGTSGDAGKNLHLNKKWAYNIIMQVGNYGEAFERNVGKNTPLKISRGLNALWSNGGLQYGPPVR
jgi:general L-amino acid transport system substrate-binding protein